MSVGNTKIAVWSNNSFLEDSFVGQTEIPEIVFEPYKNTIFHPYIVVYVDLAGDLNNISQNIISIYENARIHEQKIAVILLHQKTIDSDKTIYFENLLNKLASGKPLHRLVCTKDIYQTSLLYSESYLDRYLLEAIGNRKITISSKGKNQYFPISITDLINCLKKIFFLQSTAGKTFWAIGDPVSDLEIAYLIKKNLEDTDGPEFEIDASGQNDNDNLDLNFLGNRTRALLNWYPINNFADNLKESVRRLVEDRSLLLTKLHHLQKENRHPKLNKLNNSIKSVKKIFEKFHLRKKTKKVENKSELLTKTGEYLLVTISAIYLLLSLIFIIFSGLSLKYLEKTLSNIREGDTAQSVKNLSYSKICYQIGKTSYSTVSPVISMFLPNVHEKNYNLFVFLDYTQSSLVTIQQTYLLADKIYLTIGENVSGQFYKDASLALRSNLSQVYENLNQIQLLSSKNKLPQVLEKKISSSEEIKKITVIGQQITDILKTVELIPTFLSGSVAKNIVVLFQNSRELRSTGGVLEYALVIVMDQGRYVSKNIYSGNEIDSLAIGVISAPPLVRQFTGDNDWKFQDLNYNPDYPQTATNISWYIEKTLKFKPDIILALNDSVITSLLTEDKGVLINGRNITVDMFNRQMAEKGDHSLYKDLITHYFDRIQSHQIPLVSLGRTIANQSKENQIMFWTSDKVVESSILGQSFAGAVFPHVCPTGLLDQTPCLAQTTYLNESNFSFLPISDYLKSKILHKIWFENNIIHHEYTIEYLFTETATDLGKNINLVLQLYAPEEATLEQVTLNNRELSSRGLTMQVDKQLARFQIPVILDTTMANNIIIRFDTRNMGVIKLPFNYSLTEYRQPGTAEQEIQINITYPEKTRPSIITLPVQSGPDSLSVIMPPKTTTFGVSFVPVDR